MIDNWIDIRFERVIIFRKKLKNDEDYDKSSKELAERLKQELKRIVENVSLEYFMDNFCKFSCYSEETDEEDIIKGNKVYY